MACLTGAHCRGCAVVRRRRPDLYRLFYRLFFVQCTTFCPMRSHDLCLQCAKNVVLSLCRRRICWELCYVIPVTFFLLLSSVLSRSLYFSVFANLCVLHMQRTSRAHQCVKRHFSESTFDAKQTSLNRGLTHIIVYMICIK